MIPLPNKKYNIIYADPPWQYKRNGAVANKLQKDIKIFRGWKSVQDIREMMHQGFEKYIDLHHLHITDGCSESCEPFLDEQPVRIIDDEKTI